MSWETYHRRKEAVRVVLEDADARTRSGRALDAAALLAAHPEAEVLPDGVALLREVQLVWYQALAARLDARLADGEGGLDVAAVEAWLETAARLPGARALLDAHADEPAMAVAFDKERELLARAAGRGASPVAGRALVERARRQPVPVHEPVEVATLRPRLRDRLRGVFAA